MASNSDTESQSSQSLTKYPAPSYLCWLVSRRCNLHCSHCISASGPGVTTENDLSTNECFRVIEKLAEGGTEQLDLTGGEPLLRDDIVDITEYARERGIVVMVTTNGTTGREKYSVLTSHDVHFRLSIDGTRAVHNQVRGSGTFDEVVHAINRLQNLDASFTVNSVVHGLNYDSINEFLSFLERKGVNNVRFAFFAPTGRGATNSDRFGLSNEEYAEAKTVIREGCNQRGIEVEIDDPRDEEFLLLFPDGTIVKQVKSGDSISLGNVIVDEFANTGSIDTGTN